MASSINITRTTLGNFFIDQTQDGSFTTIFIHKNEAEEIAKVLTTQRDRGTPEQVVFSRSYGE